ncbi:MAG: hypothetical protein ACOWWM_11885 [Desulfobacterales bacterium]
MNRTIGLLVMGILLTVSPLSLAMQGHDSGGHSTGGSGSHEAGAHGTPGTFMHEAVAEGIRAEFQVMSLESMNMKDPEGNTHHIMVKLFSEGSDEQLRNVAGKVKIITPSKQETVTDLKDYSGIFAANFKVDEPGKYGVICLLKVDDKKPLYKFWYPHMN